MFFLPNITGRFPVGVATFTTPVRPAKAIGSIKLRKPVELEGNHDQPALYLEEVAFTAYYPADVDLKSKKGVSWFVRPVKESLQGFASFLGIQSWILWPVVYLFGAFLKMPAYPNAALLNPTSCHISDKERIFQWPLVIFSHGLGGNRTAYSQYCSNLAASGKVVLAVEHRDGTGVVTIPRSWNGNDKAQSRTILYMRETDIQLNDEDTATDHPLPLRGQQLAFRHHEVFITYTTLCRLVQNDPSLEIDTNDGVSYDYASWSSKNKEGNEIIRYNERVALAGHSFGGCTILSLLSTKPLEGYPSIPIHKTVILDPWLDPLPSPGPFPLQHGTDKESSADSSVVSALETALPENTDDTQTTAERHPEMLIINSETFTLWEDHYARLKKVVDRWQPEGGRILTIVGSEHISFSDFSVLPTVFRKATARPILDIIIKLSSFFLDDELEGNLCTLPTTDMQIDVIGQKKDKYGSPKRKLVGNPGDIIVE